MTIRRWSLLLGGLLILGVVVLWSLVAKTSRSDREMPAAAPTQVANNWDTGATPRRASEPAAASTPAPALVAVTSPAPPLPPAPGSEPLPAVRPVPAPNPNSTAPGEDPLQDLDQLTLAFRDYRTSLGENPVGTNSEITAALFGQNAKQLRLTLPLGSKLNAAGELCDRWGTPYFFHQLSKLEMEVRSAGQDRQMWTDDDRVAK